MAKMILIVSYAEESDFTHDGLRAFFEYRDLGIKQATGGRYHAHVIRARRDERSPGAFLNRLFASEH